MQTSENFINWLEGYLDACKNNLTANQVREIRKKLIDTKKNTSNSTVALYDSVAPTNQILTDEFIRAIEEHKNASTLEELTPVE